MPLVGNNRFCAGWEFREAERSIAAGGVLKVMSGANVRMGHGVSKVSYVWVHMFLSSNYIVKKKLI